MRVRVHTHMPTRRHSAVHRPSCEPMPATRTLIVRPFTMPKICKSQAVTELLGVFSNVRHHQGRSPHLTTPLPSFSRKPETARWSTPVSPMTILSPSSLPAKRKSTLEPGITCGVKQPFQAWEYTLSCFLAYRARYAAQYKRSCPALSRRSCQGGSCLPRLDYSHLIGPSLGGMQCCPRLLSQLQPRTMAGPLKLRQHLPGRVGCTLILS